MNRKLQARDLQMAIRGGALAVGVVLAYAMSGGTSAKRRIHRSMLTGRGDLATLVGFGPRPAGSDAIEKSRATSSGVAQSRSGAEAG